MFRYEVYAITSVCNRHRFLFYVNSPNVLYPNLDIPIIGFLLYHASGLMTFINAKRGKYFHFMFFAALQN